LRTTENGSAIDVSADIKGTRIVGAQGLGNYLHNDPRVPACLVRDVYAYGVGRSIDDREEDYLAAQAKVFASNGYRVPQLMVQIASSPEFFKVVIPKGMAVATPAVTTAQLH